MLVPDYKRIINPHVNHEKDDARPPFVRAIDEHLIARVGGIFISAVGIFSTLFELSTWGTTEGSIGLLTLDPKYTGKIVGSSIFNATILTLSLTILGILTFVHPKTGMKSSDSFETVRKKYYLSTSKKTDGFNRFTARPATILRLSFYMVQLFSGLFQDLGKGALNGKFDTQDVKGCLYASIRMCKDHGKEGLVTGKCDFLDIS